MSLAGSGANRWRNTWPNTCAWLGGCNNQEREFEIGLLVNSPRLAVSTTRCSCLPACAMRKGIFALRGGCNIAACVSPNSPRPTDGTHTREGSLDMIIIGPFFVSGDPKPQPRPRAFARRMGNAIRAGVYESGGADGWKACVAVQANMFRPQVPLSGALSVTLLFRMPRPKGHYGTGRNATVLKLASPLNHECKPDLDNLAKAVLDAMTVGGWWGDDCQITDLRVRKEWAGVGQLAGCGIEIRAQMLLR